MTLVAKLPRNIGLGGKYLAEATVAGPASYASGGFTVDTLLSTIDRATVVPRISRLAAPDDQVREITYTIAAGVITIVLEQQQLSATNTWAEVPDAQDISTVSFDVIAVGEP